MTLHVSDQVVAIHEIKGMFKDISIQRGTHGVVIKHRGEDLPIYRVKFTIPGFPGQSAVLDDLTEADITQFGPSRR
jgi:hypothetical protein